MKKHIFSVDAQSVYCPKQAHHRRAFWQFDCCPYEQCDRANKDKITKITIIQNINNLQILRHG